MSLDTAETFRSMMDKIILKPAGRAMANPLSLALVITGVIMLIISYTYDSDHKFRTFLRIFGVTVFFLFVNNHVILHDINSRQLNPDQQNILRVMERGDRGYVNGGAQPVKSGPPMVIRRTVESPDSDTLDLPDASELVTPPEDESPAD